MTYKNNVLLPSYHQLVIILKHIIVRLFRMLSSQVYAFLSGVRTPWFIYFEAGWNILAHIIFFIFHITLILMQLFCNNGSDWITESVKFSISLSVTKEADILNFWIYWHVISTIISQKTHMLHLKIFFLSNYILKRHRSQKTPGVYVWRREHTYDVT